MIGKPSLDLEVGVHRTPLSGADALEEDALVLSQGGNARLRQARHLAVSFGESEELGAVIHESDIADISPHRQRISIRKTLSAEMRHIIRMEKYATLLSIIAERRLALGDLSERALCEQAGIKPDAVRTIRRGNAPKPDTLVKLAAALRLPPSTLLDAAANVAPPHRENGQDNTSREQDLDQEFIQMLGQMTASEKIKAIEIMTILIRPDSE